MTSEALRPANLNMPWWLVLLEGIAAIILGLLLLTSPGATVMILVQVLGLYWLIKGILQIVSIFVDSSRWGWKLFVGILGIVAGIVILRHPMVSAVLIPSLTVIFVGLLGRWHPGCAEYPLWHLIGIQPPDGSRDPGDCAGRSGRHRWGCSHPNCI